jgi:hypothetical protein
MKIEIKEYDPIWKQWFEDIKSLVWPVVSHAASSIEHGTFYPMYGWCRSNGYRSL